MALRLYHISRLIDKIKRFAPERRLRSRILKYYAQRPHKVESDPALARAIANIRKNGISVYPYDFRHKYLNRHTAVHADRQSGLRYVMHGGKKLYFPRAWRTEKIKDQYNWLCMEQDPCSPHRYLTPTFDVDAQTTLFDIGSAEGILSLDVVERVKAIVIFETEEQWLEPLMKTFEPWQSKVRVVNKFVSDREDDNSVTLDGFLARDEIIDGRIMVKLDVEGAERRVLEGARHTLTCGNFDANVAVCTYHHSDDYKDLSAVMEQYGYAWSASQGYMLFIYDPETSNPPFFRRGLIYCTQRQAARE